MQRYARLITIILLFIPVIYLAGNTILAWGYAFALTHPGCNPQPGRLDGLPNPVEIWLTTKGKRQIRAWYYPGRNGAAIITSGGMEGALGQSLPPVEFLVRDGYAVLQIDSRACAKPSAAVTLGGYESEDIAAGVDFLRQSEDVERIGVFGFSMGAASAIRAAARRPEIAAVVAEGGYFNLGKDITEPDSSQPIFRKLFLYNIAVAYWLQSGINPWELSPIDELPKISPRPVLLIYGEGESESGRAGEQYAAARQPKELWIVSGGSHGRNFVEAPEEYPQRILNFFGRYLLDN